MALQTKQATKGGDKPDLGDTKFIIFFCLEVVFIIYFTLEIFFCMQSYNFGRQFFTDPVMRAWNNFDFSLVFVRV